MTKVFWKLAASVAVLGLSISSCGMNEAIIAFGASPEPDFSLSAAPAIQAVPCGATPTFVITVTPSAGFSGTVNFDVTGLPAGASATFAPASASISSAASMAVPVLTSRTTMSVVTNSTTGEFTLIVAATSGSMKRVATAMLRVAKSV